MTNLSTLLKEKEEAKRRICSNNSIFKMENHDEAYYIWKNQGVKNKTIVHIDAHNDMWWIENDLRITIANFICPALKEDIVKKIFWIVPDKTWETTKNRKKVLSHLDRITKTYPQSSKHIRIEEDQISTIVYGKPLTVCTLSNLPFIEESVLLDIDVDYLVIPYVSYRKIDKHSDLPWCWPKDLVAKLQDRKLYAELVTVAYSVEGGYTPLKWKYLGDELELRFNDENTSSLRGMELIKEAATLLQNGMNQAAEKKYLEAKNILPNSAAPVYHLALLYSESEQISTAQKFYKEAVAIDPSYRTPYNSLGPLYLSELCLESAEQEYKKILKLDPEDAYAHLGLGQIAIHRKNWNEAVPLLKKSIELNEFLTDAYRSLGDVYSKKGLYAEAIVVYEKSLKLALDGYKPLNDASIFTCTGEAHKKDLDHCKIHAKLASLYARENAITEAINGYKISIRGGYDGFFLRVYLSYLYLRKNKWQKAIQEFCQAVIKIPLALKGNN